MTRRLTALLCFLGVVLVARGARASHGTIHDLLLTGRGAEARAAIADRLAADIPMHERAALLELYALGDSWRWRRPHRLDDAPIEELPPEEGHVLSEDAWRASFAAARAELARGAFASAVVRLAVLVRDAPDFFDRESAAELHALAQVGLLERAPPPPVSPESWPESPPPRPPPPTRWYGWMTLAADGATLVAAQAYPQAGVALYFTAAPAMHVLRGHFDRAAISLGVRAGLPIGGALGGAVLGAFLSAAADGDGEEAALALGAVGAGAGAVTAVILDAAMIAREPVRPKATGSRIAPTFATRKEGGFQVGLAATW